MKTSSAVEQHLTPAEVGERLRLAKVATLALLRPGGIWPVVRINARVIRIPASSVTRFLEANTWAPRAVSGR